MIWRLIIALGLAAGPAQAGPVAAAITAIAGWSVAGVAVGQIMVHLAISYGLTALGRALTRKDAPRPPGLRSNQTTTGESTPQSLIIGKYATAGNFVCPPMTHGQDGSTPNAWLTYVIDLADLPLSSLDAVWIDDTRLVPGPEDAEGIPKPSRSF